MGRGPFSNQTYNPGHPLAPSPQPKGYTTALSPASRKPKASQHALGGGSTEIRTLRFEDTDLEVRDMDGRLWLTAEQIGQALGYSSKRASVSVLTLYRRNQDEFTDEMSTDIKLMSVDGKEREIRVFSPRGCHLLAMFARTERAKKFRAWVLDVLEGLERTLHPATIEESLPCVWWGGAIVPPDWTPERMTNAMGFLLRNWNLIKRSPGLTRERYQQVRHYTEMGLKAWEISRIIHAPVNEVSSIRIELDRMEFEGIMFLLD